MTLKEKIVEMLACDEIYDRETIKRDYEKLGREEVSKSMYRIQCEEALEKYEEIIQFILFSLDNNNGQTPETQKTETDTTDAPEQQTSL